SVRSTVEDAAALAAARQRRAVRAAQLVGGSQVLAHTEIEIALGVERQTGQPVVWIIDLGIEEDDAALLVCLAVAVVVAHTQILVAPAEVYRTVVIGGEVHARRGALEERREAVSLAVAVGVLKEADTVVLGTFVILRPKVRVALDDQQP